ncbi:MAG: AI-2E family transporter [Methylacidiphilales bacterium]|nr:AI-2E family transporter [Candidatus Methylacidiphilales bacterium]
MDRSLASGPLVWLGIILTTCLLLVFFQTMLWLVLPLLLAVVSYYLLSPLVNMAMARGLTRERAVFIVTVLLTIFLAAEGFIIVPKIASASHNWQDKLADYGRTGEDLVMKAKQSVSKYFPFLHPPESQTGGMGVGRIGFVESGATPTPSSNNELENQVENLPAKYSGEIAMEALRWVPSLLLVPYMTYFFLLDGPRFKRFLVRAIPNAFFEKTLYLFYRVEDQMRRYFRGLLSLTALDAVCLGVGLWFLGLEAPFFLASLAAVMAWLPYLGSIAGGLLVVLVAAHDAPNQPWLPYEVVGLFIAVRMLDDFVFMPLTIGRSLRMHPLVTVLMILLGGAVAGISGLLLVMPVLGVVMVAGQIIGELVTDERVLARYRHARHLRQLRAKADL